IEQPTPKGLRYILIGEDAANALVQCYGFNLNISPTQDFSVMLYKNLLRTNYMHTNYRGERTKIENFALPLFNIIYLINIDTAKEFTYKITLNEDPDTSIYVASPELLIALSLSNEFGKISRDTMAKLINFYQ